MAINNFPYTDFGQINLDFILRRLNDLGATMSDFVATNSITFEGVWTINNPYAAWSVVVSGSDSYISVKPVPAGVVLANSDYWLPLGIAADMFNTLNTRVNGIDARVTALESGTTDETVLFIGDSWGTRNTDVLPTTIAGCLNVNLYSTAKGKTGFAKRSASTAADNFEEQIQSAANAPALNNASVRHIVVVGGTNDYQNGYLVDSDGNPDAAQYAAVIGRMYATMVEHFPNARLYIFPNMAFESDKRSNMYSKLWKTIAHYCAIYHTGVVIPDSVNYLGVDQFYDYDTAAEIDLVHPSRNGLVWLAQTIAAQLQGAQIEYINSNAQKISVSGASGNVTGTVEVSNTARTMTITAHIKISGDALSAKTALTINTSGGLKPDFIQVNPLSVSNLSNANNAAFIQLGKATAAGACGLAVEFRKDDGAGNPVDSIALIPNTTTPTGYYSGSATFVIFD